MAAMPVAPGPRTLLSTPEKFNTAGPARGGRNTRGVTERTRTIIEAVGLILIGLALCATVVLLLPLIWACIAFGFGAGSALVAVSQVAKADNTP
jgi:hypothetical protein